MPSGMDHLPGMRRDPSIPAHTFRRADSLMLIAADQQQLPPVQAPELRRHLLAEPIVPLRERAQKQAVRRGVQGRADAHEDLQTGDGDRPLDIGEIVVVDSAALADLALPEPQSPSPGSDPLTDLVVVDGHALTSFL